MNATPLNHTTEQPKLSTAAKKIVFTVTTDLSYDQRMIRIATSLAQAGFSVKLIGRKLKSSIALQQQPFEQKRITCFFEKGKLFYAEYTIRLFFYLLFQPMDCIVAIDLDTILPCYFISRIKKAKRVYDAHELFCEMKEIVTRPAIYQLWKRIEKFAVPKFAQGYTVNEPIAAAFTEMYCVQYSIIRNIALLRDLAPPPQVAPFIIYQGAVNEGRSFETLIPAMQWVNCPLVICGDGNFMAQTRQLVKNHQLEDKVIFKGKLPPDALRSLTQKAYAGITLFDEEGLSNYYSLANRFFDYLHAGIPQLCVDYPVYRAINNQQAIAVLVKDISSQSLATELNNLLENAVLHQRLQQNCLAVRQTLNWQTEAITLIEFYKNLWATS